MSNLLDKTMVVVRDDVRVGNLVNNPQDNVNHSSDISSVQSNASESRGRGVGRGAVIGGNVSHDTSSVSTSDRLDKLEEGMENITRMLQSLMNSREAQFQDAPGDTSGNGQRNIPRSGNANPQQDMSGGMVGSLDGSQFSTTQRYKPIPVKDWGVNFSGDTNGLKVKSFLRDMEKMASTQRVSLDSVLSAVHLCLSGDALKWYRSRETFFTWNEFARAISYTFGRLDGDLSVRRRLEERRQREGERVGVYLSEMYSLFRELEVEMDERSKIQLVRRNLAQKIRDSILFMNFGSLLELEGALAIVENNLLIAQKEDKPRNIRVNEVQGRRDSSPGQSEARNDRRSQRNNHSAQRNNNNSRGSQNRRNSGSSPNYPLCVNCFLGNHLVKDCSQPKRANILCYGCGRENVIRENCPTCSRSGEDGAGQ